MHIMVGQHRYEDSEVKIHLGWNLAEWGEWELVKAGQQKHSHTGMDTTWPSCFVVSFL